MCYLVPIVQILLSLELSDRVKLSHNIYNLYEKHITKKAGSHGVRLVRKTCSMTKRQRKRYKSVELIFIYDIK